MNAVSMPLAHNKVITIKPQNYLIMNTSDVLDIKLLTFITKGEIRIYVWSMRLKYFELTEQSISF